jgi:hypothetical protein
MEINSNFIYDLDAIMDFVFGGTNERTSDVEITETQVKDDNGKLETESRITREVKSKNNDRVQIRYDMLSKFIDILNDVEIDQDIMPLSLTQQIILNTMAENGLLKEKK